MADGLPFMAKELLRKLYRTSEKVIANYDTTTYSTSVINCRYA